MARGPEGALEMFDVFGAMAIKRLHLHALAEARRALGGLVLRGLTPARLEVLESIARNPAGVGQASLARELGVSRSTLYRMLAALEALGWVAREPIETWNHQRIVRLTADGLAVLDDARERRSGNASARGRGRG